RAFGEGAAAEVRPYKIWLAILSAVKLAWLRRGDFGPEVRSRLVFPRFNAFTFRGTGGAVFRLFGCGKLFVACNQVWKRPGKPRKARPGQVFSLRCRSYALDLDLAACVMSRG